MSQPGMIICPWCYYPVEMNAPITTFKPSGVSEFAAANCSRCTGQMIIEKITRYKTRRPRQEKELK